MIQTFSIFSERGGVLIALRASGRFGNVRTLSILGILSNQKLLVNVPFLFNLNSRILLITVHGIALLRLH
jgi:hypothetical protein